MRTLQILALFSLLFLFSACYIGCGRKKQTDAQEQHIAEQAEDQEEHSRDEQGNENHSGEIVLKPEIIAEVAIEVVPLTKRDFKQIKDFPGTVVPRPDGEAHIGSLVSGRVVEIAVGLGENITKGSLLCRIESPEVGEAQAKYIRAAAEYQFAQKELLRQQKLNEEKIGAEKILFEKEATAQSAHAQLVAAEHTLQSIGFSKSEIEDLMRNSSASGVLTLKSPISGTVTDREIHLGQRVEPERDLFHIVDLSQLWIQISLYEKDLGQIACRQSVDIIPQSYPNNVFKGKIVQIGREVKQETRSIDCFIEVENRDAILIPNLFVTCRVLIGSNSGQIIAVPEHAIVIDEHGDKSVFIEHEPGCYLPKEVLTGRSSDGWAEIVDGLQEGDRVVFKGAFFIKSEAAKGSFGHGHAH